MTGTKFKKQGQRKGRSKEDRLGDEQDFNVKKKKQKMGPGTQRGDDG